VKTSVLYLYAAVTKLGKRQREKRAKLGDLTDIVRLILTQSDSKKENMVSCGS
jgi:hypothetical protein